VPGEADAGTVGKLQAYCAARRAFCLVDSPKTASTNLLLAINGPFGFTGATPTFLGASAYGAENSAYYFPWVRATDPLLGNRPRLFPPSGFVAGIYAATDGNRGVWKAPAGTGAVLSGELGLQFDVTDGESDQLEVLAVNCLRNFSVGGDVVWGARTLQGSDAVSSDWKYVNVRRFALFLESSLTEGTRWVVFEPNDETLWEQVRMNIGSFLQGLFLRGAFQGTTPQQAYFVKCDGETNTQASIDQGIVNILVGFAPLTPAEFVVVQIQQVAGQSNS
jgi:phage tail sheath protein FI